VTRPCAADDFGTIRARIEDLRRERAQTASAERSEQSTTAQPHWDVDESRLCDLERRGKEKSEGTPLPWVPTIFFGT
jgi:hypothetical protein